MGWEPEFVDSFLCWSVKVACPYGSPPDLIDTNWGWFFFWALCFAQVFVLLLLTSAIGGFVSRNLALRRTELELQALLKGCEEMPSLTILLPCYLPNEQSILMETVAHVIGRLRYGRPFTLLVCYNTPHPLPIEDELAQLDGQEYSPAVGWGATKGADSVSPRRTLNFDTRAEPEAPPESPTAAARAADATDAADAADVRSSGSCSCVEASGAAAWSTLPVEELEHGCGTSTSSSPPCAATPLPPTLAPRSGQRGNLLRVLKVAGSRSKAENLNAALELVETENVLIYDADHHPDEGSLLLLTAHMRVFDCACVQGSTYLRHRRSLFDFYINSEFFVTHFVFFPAMQFLTACGVFGGSNALWKADALRGYGFRHDVQTEDIELSTRAMLRRVRIRFCPEARSGELPPATFLALYRQRLRWALGWDQVTIQHFRSIGSSDLSCREKASLYWILPMRWLILFSATLNAIVTPVVGFGYKIQTPGASLGLPIDGCITLAGASFITVSAVVLVSAIMHEPPALWLAVLLFQVSGIMYISWQLLLAVVSLSKICIGADGGWIVTARAASTSAASSRSRSESGVFSPRGLTAKGDSQLNLASDDHAYYKLP